MPHLFVNRSRAYDLLESSEKAGRTFVWESVNAILYVIGGFAFIFGSLFFFPALEAEINWGVWGFFFGSLLYLLVTAHDLVEVLRYRRDAHRGRRLELIAASGYLAGTILFLVGSALFFTFVDWIIAGAWCFIIGSLLFTVAPFVNVLQVHHLSERALRLYTLTGISFVAGAVLFTTASIPYLWDLGDSALATELSDFLGAQYLVGSVLFLAGGFFNYVRAWVRVREYRAQHTAASPRSEDSR
jgi:hypothetical protein